jgi:hypothetical protein
VVVNGALLSPQGNSLTTGAYSWVYLTVPASSVNASWTEWTPARINSTNFGALLGVSGGINSTIHMRMSEMALQVWGPPGNASSARMNVPITTIAADNSTDELKDTYYVAEAATGADTLLGSNCAVTSVGTQTVAGTYDGIASTRHRLHFVGDATAGAWSGSLSVDWSALSRVGTYAGDISFIRVIYKVKATYLSGQGNYVSDYDNAYFLTPRWGGFSQPPAMLPISLGASGEVYADYALDNLSEAWTHAKLIGQQFGFELLGFGPYDAETQYPDLDCEEFRVEVYGPK